MKLLMDMTMAGSVTTLVILSVKWLFKDKLTPKWHVFIWAILLVRLIVPMLPESQVSLFNIVPNIEEVTVVNRSLESIPARTEPFVEGIMVMQDQDKFFVIHKSAYDQAFIIWAIGTCLLLSYFVSVYYIFCAKVRKMKLCNDNDVLDLLKRCKRRLHIKRDVQLKIGSRAPLVIGVRQPKIIIQQDYTIDELEHVLIHELCHLKNGDLCINVLSTGLLCLNWFNPLMWVAFFVLSKDIERYCDQRVLEVVSDRKMYASVLLKTAMKKNHFILCSSSLQNGEKEIKKRIMYIADFKKPKVLWSMVAILIAIVIGAVCLTNGVASDSQQLKRAENLWQYKTAYVGDNSKVSNLIYTLPLAEHVEKIFLSTAERPYGIVVDYVYTEVIDEKVEGQLFNNMAIMFALIDNVDEISFKLYHNEASSGSYMLYALTREDVKEILEKDIRLSANTETDFAYEVLVMLESREPYNWTADEIEEIITYQESLIYHNQTYGFELIFPESWKDKFLISDENRVLFIQNKKIAELNDDNIGYFGVLFRIEVYSKNSYTAQQIQELSDAYGYTILAETDENYIGYAHPTDVQVPMNNESLCAEYREMEEDVPNIIKTFQLIS